MSKCLNAQILIAAPIRVAIRVADRVQGPQYQAVLVLCDHLALVRVDQAVLVMMTARHVGMTGVRLVTVRLVVILVIGLLAAMTGVRLVTVRRVVILVIVRRVGMIGVLMTGPHVVILVIVRRVEILVIVLRAAMIGALLVTVRRAEILVIVLLVVMIAVRMIGPLVVILVIVPRVVMIGALTTVRLVVILVTVRLVVILVTVLLVVMIAEVRMIGPHVATALALVGRLVRAVMTVVMVGDEAVHVKKTLLPASRVMRRSAGVQRFVPAVRVPYERTWSKLQCRVSPNRGLMRVPLKVPVFNPWSATARV